MYGIEIPKQRGIYSEILTTEDTENLRVSLIWIFEFVLKVVFRSFRKYQPSDRRILPLVGSTKFRKSHEPSVSLRPIDARII